MGTRIAAAVILALIFVLILPGCATQRSAANPVGTAIIAHNTIKNAQQLTGAARNLLRNYNRSQGGF
jgi:hypothetical protein